MTETLVPYTTRFLSWREPIETFMNDHAWAWPGAETLHFVGMALLFGVSLLLLMRMLGAMKSIPFAGLHRLLPMGILGFVLRSEEHTSELQSLMRLSYAVLCLKKKNHPHSSYII